jgi:glycosidase
MAKNTPLKWRKLNIYSIFTRNFSEQGTFDAIHSTLDRIKYLGTDVIWFLPFYPIGEEKRKGNVGSPYAVQDHRIIDEAHGTKGDFELLVKEIHKREMKVMIDIVYNHTAPDSVLVKEHGEWFNQKADGSFNNRVEEWTDTVALDYSNEDLWDYQIETLKEWAQIVDGFHCNAAPLVPLKFWKRARKEIEAIKPHFIWLAETVERNFIENLRKEHVPVHSDSEMYQAFDLTYEYDVHREYQDYLAGDIPLSKFVYALNLQESTYPWNFVKMRFLENHDQERVVTALADIEDLIQWTAFNYLQKGATLIYNGQEVAARHLPSLFEKDPIDWQTGINLNSYMAHLAKVKKQYVPEANVKYHLEAFDALDTVVMYYEDAEEKRIGVFNLKHKEGEVPIKAPDDEYKNLLNNHPIEIIDGKIALTDSPMFFIVAKND